MDGVGLYLEEYPPFPDPVDNIDHPTQLSCYHLLLHLSPYLCYLPAWLPGYCELLAPAAAVASSVPGPPAVRARGPRGTS